MNKNSEPAQTIDTVDQSKSSSPTRKPLRWWPAVVLLLVLAVLRGMLLIDDSPSLEVLLTAFFGSAIVAVLLLVWWLFASRASIKEKLILTCAYVAIALVASLASHRSMQGVIFVLFVLPMGTAAFTLGLILTSYRPSIRIPTAIVAALIGFGAFLAIQVEGFDAKFHGDYVWRWQKTSEDDFIASLEGRNKSEKVEDAKEAVAFQKPDWAGFRGNDRTGVVDGITLADNWKEAPPQEVWRTKIGPGWSSFSVAGKRLFTQEQRGEEEAVVCLDADTGKIVWEYVYPGRFWEAIGGAGPRGTPTITEQGIFTLGGNGTLLRLDASTGKLIWQRDLKVDAGREPPTWGFASSPLVIDSLVVVFAGGPNGKGVLAYDVQSGNPVWSVASGVHSYSSAQAATFSGVPGILMLSDNGVQFLATKDGSVIWHYDWKQEDYRVVQPLLDGDSVLVGASLGTGARHITVKKTDSGWDVKEDWSTRDLKPDFNDSVLYDGYIYGFDSGIFCCVKMQDGSRAWKRGRYGNGQVILMPQSGQLLVSSEKGEIILLKATPKKLDELAKFSALDGKTWNHPVLIGDRLYIRNAEEAACFKMPLKQAEPAKTDTALRN